MSDWDENSKKVLLGQILDREQIEGLVEPRVAPDAKYKQRDARDPKSLPDLRPGLPLVARRTDGGWGRKANVIGYLGCIVLDYDEVAGGWNTMTNIIVQVVASSSPKLDHEVGRLRTVLYTTWGFSTRGMRVVALGKANWDKYHLLGNRPGTGQNDAA